MGVFEITQVSDIVAELEGSLKVQERGNLISESPREYTLRRVFCRGGWGGRHYYYVCIVCPYL